MSLYSQQSYYGQPSYSGPTFPPAPAHNSGYQYQYPPPQAPAVAPPPAFHHVDPTTFRRDYANRLSQLTFNSRPVIQGLSMLAQDYSRFADIVAQSIEGHIRRVPPWMKLPAFYLLDAISKNVYEPYARHFASFVIPLFLETYRQVDENTRSKMEEMLLTWRTGAPTGKELFGVAPQVAIERGVWGDAGATNASGFYTGSGQITKAQVLSELQYTLGQKERAVQSNPYDSLSQNHINVLQQLRKLVEAGVSQEELQQILSQLRTLVRSSGPPPSAPPVPTPQWQPLQFTAPPVATYTQPDTPYPPVKMESTPSAPIASSSSQPAPVVPENIATLLSTLLKAGVVSATGTPVGAGATAMEDSKLQSIENVDMKRDASREYKNVVLSQKIKLNSSEITRTRPRIVELLYGRLSNQCKQCGIRFADSDISKKTMEDHLDMHFRQNRKATQNIGRGHSRSWFVGIEDWIYDVSGDKKGKERADGRGRLNPKAAAAAENAKRDADLRAQYVVVPPGDEAKPVACPICKEILKSEFLEDDEDWVWKNAVKKDDTVYHATCHAEAVVSTSSLAARLRSEIAHGSRSGTPEAQIHSGTISRATPPPVAARISKSKSPSLSPSPEAKLAGTKRKIEPTDSTSTSTEADGTPPFKKLALSVP